MFPISEIRGACLKVFTGLGEENRDETSGQCKAIVGILSAGEIYRGRESVLATNK
jgi:hypothetical protein